VFDPIQTVVARTVLSVDCREPSSPALPEVRSGLGQVSRAGLTSVAEAVTQPEVDRLTAEWTVTCTSFRKSWNRPSAPAAVDASTWGAFAAHFILTVWFVTTP
jgi:hypothetical protein